MWVCKDFKKIEWKDGVLRRGSEGVRFKKRKERECGRSDLKRSM